MPFDYWRRVAFTQRQRIASLRRRMADLEHDILVLTKERDASVALVRHFENRVAEALALADGRPSSPCDSLPDQVTVDAPPRPK